VDRSVAREMFIANALVEGEWATHHRFRDANRDALADVRHLEDRYRRDDLVDPGAVFDFYDARVGADAVSGRHFDSWWRKVRSTTPDLLTLRLEDLLRLRDGEHPLADFPDEWCNGDLVLPITYRFMPGALNDGVTVHIALSVLNRVEDAGFDWQVPAYRDDLIEALMRSLPKEYRRLLTPAAETIAAVQTVMARSGNPEGGPIVEALARTVLDVCSVEVPAKAFDLARVPDHLRITFAVHDGQRVAGLDKDLGALRRSLSGRLRAAIAAATPLAERSGIVDWTDLGTIPQMIETVRDGHAVRGYPTLLDTGEAVSLRIVANADLQARVMPAGVRRLLLLNGSPSRKQLTAALGNTAQLAVARQRRISLEALVDDCIAASVDHLIAGFGRPVWDRDTFEELLSVCHDDVFDLASGALRGGVEILTIAGAIDRQLAKLVAPAVVPSASDARRQLDRLVHPGFVTRAGLGRVDDIVRYVRGIERRLAKVADDVLRDRARMAEVHALESRITRVADRYTHTVTPPDVVAAAWLIEELRIQQFAQMVGTRGSISLTKVSRELSRLEAEAAGQPPA